MHLPELGGDVRWRVRVCARAGGCIECDGATSSSCSGNICAASQSKELTFTVVLQVVSAVAGSGWGAMVLMASSPAF